MRCYVKSNLPNTLLNMLCKEALLQRQRASLASQRTLSEKVLI